MGRTHIPYADYTCNPVVGCTAIASGCKNCWSEYLHTQRHKAAMNGRGPLPQQYEKPFEVIQLRPERLQEPLHWRKPGTIFVNSMSDTFHTDVPYNFIVRMFAVMAMCPQHTFLVFTKRWGRAADFYDRLYVSEEGNKAMGDAIENLGGDADEVDSAIAPPMENVHVYFSASTQKEVDDAVPILLEIPAAKRGLSLEPLLEYIDLEMIRSALGAPPSDPGRFLENSRIDSVIVGCESGSNRRRCEIEWIRSIVEQCRDAGVKVYVKQMDLGGKVEADMGKFPDDLQIRDI